MGNIVNKSTFQSEITAVTQAFETAISTNTATGYDNARSIIESIINTYASDEVPTSEYPEDMSRVVSLFPVVSGITHKHITVQILYRKCDNSKDDYILHTTLVPGPNQQALALVPHQTSYNEVLPPDAQFDNRNLNVLSTLKRAPKCKPKKCCKPRPCKRYYDCDYDEYDSDEYYD